MKLTKDFKILPIKLKYFSNFSVILMLKTLIYINLIIEYQMPMTVHLRILHIKDMILSILNHL